MISIRRIQWPKIFVEYYLYSEYFLKWITITYLNSPNKFNYLKESIIFIYGDFIKLQSISWFPIRIRLWAVKVLFVYTNAYV